MAGAMEALMRHERLRCNRLPEAVDPNVGFLSGLTGKPIVRAVALLLTLHLSGCYTQTWLPLAPAAGPLPDCILVRAPESDTFPHGLKVDLFHPWMDSDSVLVGTQGFRGHELRDSDGMPVTLRLPAGELEVASRIVFSPGRTAAAVVFGLGVSGVLAYLIAAPRGFWH